MSTIYCPDVEYEREIVKLLFNAEPLKFKIGKI